MLTQPSSTLHLPRILSLHGGGTNANVFAMQCRNLTPELNKDFRLVFADAPFICDAHPDIIPVYGKYGPFRLWMRWLQEQQGLPAEAVIDEIEYNIRMTMQSDEGTGEWVGLLGFSQGANVAASMLYERQLLITAEKNEDAVGFGGQKWRFAVLMAGRAPLLSLSGFTDNNKAFRVAGEIQKWTDPSSHVQRPVVGTKLKLPTVHVHGLLDEGLVWHRHFRDAYCDEELASLVEWNGDHRIPIKTNDVRIIVDATVIAAQKAGIPLNRVN